MIARRAGDNFNLPNPVYVPGTGPAEYQLTPPGFLNPILQNARLSFPRVTHSSQFRPNGPPDLNSRASSTPTTRSGHGIACPNPATARALQSRRRSLVAHRAVVTAVQRIARTLTLRAPADIWNGATSRPGLSWLRFVIGVEGAFFYRFLRRSPRSARGRDGVPATAAIPPGPPRVTRISGSYPPRRNQPPGAGVKNAFGSHTSFDTPPRRSRESLGTSRHRRLCRRGRWRKFTMASLSGPRGRWSQAGQKVGKYVLRRALRPLDDDDDER